MLLVVVVAAVPGGAEHGMHLQDSLPKQESETFVRLGGSEGRGIGPGWIVGSTRVMCLDAAGKVIDSIQLDGADARMDGYSAIFNGDRTQFAVVRVESNHQKESIESPEGFRSLYVYDVSCRLIHRRSGVRGRYFVLGPAGSYGFGYGASGSATAHPPIVYQLARPTRSLMPESPARAIFGVSDLKMASDRKKFAVGSGGHDHNASLFLYGSDGALRWTLPLFLVKRFTFSPDSKAIAVQAQQSATSTFGLLVASAADGQIRWQEGDLYFLDFLAGGRRFLGVIHPQNASGSVLGVFDIDSGKLHFRWQDGSLRIFDATATQDGRWLLVAAVLPSGGERVYLIDAKRGRHSYIDYPEGSLQRFFQGGMRPEALRFVDNGRRIVLALRDRVELFDVQE